MKLKRFSFFGLLAGLVLVMAVPAFAQQQILQPLTVQGPVKVRATPYASATKSLLQLGITAIASGSASGTYAGMNAASGYVGDFANWQLNGTKKFGVDYTGAVTIGGGAPVKKVLTGTGTLNFASTASGASADLTITVTGAAVGDVVTLGIPNASVPTGAIAFTAWVSASDTVSVRFANFSGGALDPASGSFRANVTQM
jgi:hypothetical protein